MTVVRRIVDQVRGLITRAFHAVRQEWRTGRVSFNGLAPVDRLAAGLAMGVIVVARVVVVAATLELGWPGRVAEVPALSSSPEPRCRCRLLRSCWPASANEKAATAPRNVALGSYCRSISSTGRSSPNRW